MDEHVPIQLAVEDKLSEVVLRAVLDQSGRDYEVGSCLSRRGSGYLRKTIRAFNNAAKGTPFIVLTDLDDAQCAPALIRDWLTVPKHPNLVFRVAVREVEAWVLAHRTAFADFLGIKQEILPKRPDKLKDPKSALIHLARKSRRRSLREAIAPRRGSTATKGRGYNATLGRFVEGRWNARAAMKVSPSLRRAFEAISDFKPKLAKKTAPNEGQ